MKAAVCARYGLPEVLKIADIADPIARAKDVVIRVHATAVTPSDCYIRSMIPTAPLLTRMMAQAILGFTKPRRPILGAVLAGEVDSVGIQCTRFCVGGVWAFTLLRMGCYAQRVCLPQSFRLLTKAPLNLSFEEAAALLSGGLLALHFLSKANITNGQRVLVYGASGANGTTAIQLAKHFGADVTAVSGPTNLELSRALGADTVLDYTNENAPALGRYDVVFDAVGRKRGSALKAAARTAFTPTGKYLSVDDELPRIGRNDLMRLKELAEAGTLKPVIDRQYPLERIAEAHRYVEQGHKKGNVIVTVAG